MATYPPNQTTPKKGSDGYLWNWLGSPLKKFAAAISPYITGGGGGGKFSISVTYLDLLDLITNGELSPGSTYKITGFNKNMPSGGPDNPNGYLPEILYDDGTDSGITIYMDAVSATEMATSGYGEFYNPKYYDGNDYSNTDGTGLYGIWDGDNPDPLQVPAYGVGDVVFWGGYAWQNVTGNVGNSLTPMELSIDWVKLPYTNTTYYTKVVDAIKVDWDNGVVIERYNAENQILVTYATAQYDWWVGMWPSWMFGTPSYSPISVMGWGLYSKVTPEGIDNQFYGISNIENVNSIVETVNFKGVGFLNNRFIQNCYCYDNYWGIDGYVTENTFTGWTNFYGNVFAEGSDIYECRMAGGSLNANTFYNMYMYANVLNYNAQISNNYNSSGTNVTITGNTLGRYSSIAFNSMDNGYMDGNTLTQNSSIQANIFLNGSIGKNQLVNSSYIQGNTVDNANIDNNMLTNNCNISINILTTGSLINSNTINAGGNINTNGMINGSIIMNNMLNAANINTNTLDSGNINLNELTNSTIFVNIISSNGSINSNSFNMATLYSATLSNSANITNNRFINCSVDLAATGPISAVNFFNNNFNSVAVNANLSAATHVYAIYPTEIFQRVDGTPRLSYCNNSDAIVVVAVTA